MEPSCSHIVVLFQIFHEQAGSGWVFCHAFSVVFTVTSFVSFLHDLIPHLLFCHRRRRSLFLELPLPHLLQVNQRRGRKAAGVVKNLICASFHLTALIRKPIKDWLPSIHHLHLSCSGKIINNHCADFNQLPRPTPSTFDCELPLLWALRWLLVAMWTLIYIAHPEHWKTEGPRRYTMQPGARKKVSLVPCSKASLERPRRRRQVKLHLELMFFANPWQPPSLVERSWRKGY